MRLWLLCFCMLMFYLRVDCLPQSCQAWTRFI